MITSIGGEDEDFIDAAKEIPLLNDKSYKLTHIRRKFYLDYDFRMDFVWQYFW
jgi:hypothetical protein